jgi:aspartyl-tRNA(Asn)/glutamyl-tRNA(Gln) amidotransferase subunit A
MTNLNELTLIEALEGLKAKKFSSSDLVSACYSQIEKHEDKINAFVTIVPKETALSLAKKADEFIASNEQAFSKRPLLGIPYACKDNFCTRGIETTASSNILKGFIPPYESTVTKKLKDAGAILIGKTNMDAFAHGASTETSDFFITKNPWDTTRLPGGSSGGSAAAVAADMCTFALGSETGGSIRCPASWCGVTGFKPTYGRNSRYGLIAMMSSTDSPGPMTKTVLDAAKVLEVIAGKDPFDATSLPAGVGNYVESATAFDLKGLKVGKPVSYFMEDVDAPILEAVNVCLSRLEELGAQVVEVELTPPKYALAVYTILQRSEVSSNLARFDGIRYGHTRDDFGFEARKRMMLGAYSLSVGYYDQYYGKGQKVRTKLINDFEEVFKKADILVSPNMPSVAMEVGAIDSSPLFGELVDRLHLASSLAGIPAVVLPCGFENGLPIGVQFMGPQLGEARILGTAHAYQESTDFHKERPKL